MEICWSRVEDFKTIFWTKGATIFRASQVLEDVRMFVRGKMFTNASSKVSIGFTNITGTTACTRKLVNDSHRKLAGMGSLAPNQLLILNGVNTNLIYRSLHNVLTNFLILCCVMIIIIHINVSLCDTIYCKTSFYLICTTDDGWWFIWNMSWLNNMNFKTIVWFIKANLIFIFMQYF